MTTEIQLTTLRDILNVVFKNQSRIIAIVIISTLISYTYCFLVTERYQADTKLLVQVGREKFTSLSPTIKDSYNVVFQERIQNINNEIEMLDSLYLTERAFPKLVKILEQGRQGEQRPKKLFARLKLFAKQIIKNLKDGFDQFLYQLGIAVKLPEDKALLLTFHNSLKIELLEETDVISLKFVWPDPKFAAAAVAVFAEEYMDLHAEVFQTEGSFSFYQEQIDLYAEKLKKGEEELSNFRSNLQISHIVKQEESLIAEIAGLEKNITDNELDLKGTSLMLESINTMAVTPGVWVETPNMPKIGDRLTDLAKIDQIYYELMAEKQSLLERFTEISREVQSVQRKLEEIKGQKTVSLKNILLPRIEVLKMNQEILEQKFSEKLQRLNTLSINSTRLTALERELEINRNHYLLYSSKAEEFRIAQGLDKNKIISIKLLKPATVPLKPFFPQKRLIISLTALFALFLGSSYAIVREFFDQTVNNSIELQRIIQKPILATIPDVDFASPGNGEGIIKESWNNLYHMFSELLTKDTAGKMQTYAFTSPNAGEGVSTLSVNAALALQSVKNGKVIWINANLRAPNTPVVLGAGKSKGLSDLLTSDLSSSEVISIDPASGLHYIAAGREVNQATLMPSVLFQSEKFSNLIHELVSRFEIVIFDAPPVIPYVDTTNLIRLCDGAILVTKAGETKLEIAKAAIQRLEQNQCEILGAIINQKKYYIPDFIYRYI